MKNEVRFLTGAILLMTATTTLATDLLYQEFCRLTYDDKLVAEIESALEM